MSDYHFLNPSFPPVRQHHCCPYCYHAFVTIQDQAGLYPADDDDDELVSLSTLYDLLDEQQHYYQELLQQQERSYRAFLQMLMDTSSSRMDGLLREMHDLRNCLQKTKADLAEVRKQGVLNSKRAECLAEGLVTVRGTLDGGGGSLAGGVANAGRRGVELKQRRGGAGGVLRMDRGGKGVGARCREVKKAEPKAAKLVADLTDIHFDDFKVGNAHTRRE